MDNLFPLIVFALIAAFSAWLKKRRQEGEGDSWQEQPPPVVPSAPATDWEEEMKRLLGVPTAPSGGAPAPPEVPPPLPAAPVAAPRPRPAPRPGPSPVTRREPARPRPDVVQAAADQSALLAKARSTHERAKRMEARVSQRLSAISGNLGRKKAARGVRAGSTPAAQAVELLKTRSGLRSAVLASIVLGPPKA